MDAFFLKIIFTPKLYDCKYYQTIWFTGKKIIIGQTQVRSLVYFFFLQILEGQPSMIRYRVN